MHKRSGERAASHKSVQCVAMFPCVSLMASKLKYLCLMSPAQGNKITRSAHHGSPYPVDCIPAMVPVISDKIAEAVAFVVTSASPPAA